MTQPDSTKGANTQSNAIATRQTTEHAPIRQSDVRALLNKPSPQPQNQLARGDADSQSRVAKQLNRDAEGYAQMDDNRRDLKSILDGAASGKLTTGEAGELAQSLSKRELVLAAAIKDGKLGDAELKQINQLDRAFDKKLDQLAGNAWKADPAKAAQVDTTKDLARNLAQQSLMLRGIGDSSLTPKELSAVLETQASLHALIACASHDGSFNQTEKKNLDTAAMQSDKLRFELRHNDEGYVAGSQTAAANLQKEAMAAQLKSVELGLDATAGIALPPGLSTTPALVQELDRRAEFNQQWRHEADKVIDSGSASSQVSLSQSAQSEMVRRQLFDSSHVLNESLINPNFPNNVATPDTKSLIEREVARRQDFNRAWQASPAPENIFAAMKEFESRNLFDAAVSIYRSLPQSEWSDPASDGATNDPAVKREYEMRKHFDENFLSRLSNWSQSLNDSRPASPYDKLAIPGQGFSLDNVIAGMRELERRQKVDSGLLNPGQDLA